ncbi:MAG: prepilin-type N-terminal cleavage/methylation domain-containing protein [Gemmatimonadaceae bacterium]|jgi:prepilin-type N-terminal cleavage/methylation domain-containing protein|nr:prepilin-type N-terminal cleavage/methylation domain-containing protein [Gemmatimonadaceae bacterium]
MSRPHLSHRAPAARLGFTIVELLMAVIVVGILASVAIPDIGSAKDKAARSAAIGEMRTFAAAQEAFFQEHDRYAGSADLAPAPTPGKLAFRWSAGAQLLGVTAVHGGWNVAVRMASGKPCALAIGHAPLPASVPGLVHGIPACAP